MTTLITTLIVLAALWFSWRIFKVATRLRPTAEPPDAVDVREPVPRRPLNRAGAVAIEEPQDDRDDDLIGK